MVCSFENEEYGKVTSSGSVLHLELVRKWIDVCEKKHHKHNIQRRTHRDDIGAPDMSLTTTGSGFPPDYSSVQRVKILDF